MRVNTYLHNAFKIAAKGLALVNRVGPLCIDGN
jgi:hypothetical protein